ncbi:MAG: SCP-2 sterol transfer family protein [Chromatiales bacterium]|jgi:hypothetical protein
MAELFSAEWMEEYMKAWNAEPELSGALEKIDFNSTIGYGFPDDPQPKGYIRVEHGKVTQAGEYSGEELSWDLRAKEDNWRKWMAKEIGMAGLGMAATTGKLKFKKGEYGAMIKDPRMAGPFIKSFAVMGRGH